MTNKQAKSLMDVVKIMNKNFYDFIGEDIKTIGSNGKRRIVLLFERNGEYGYEDHDINKQELIGNNFKVEKYNDGHYYQVYRCLQEEGLIKDMKQLIKNTINSILDIFMTLCIGYFYLFLLGSVINMLTTNTYVLRLTLCALAILIISNKIKDKVLQYYIINN